MKFKKPRLFVLAHGPSNGAKALAEALGCKRLKNPHILRQGDTVINWGNSGFKPPRAPGMWHPICNIVNEPEAIAAASNKLIAFERLEEGGVQNVPFTTDIEVARSWLEERGAKVVERHLLRGSSGRGIRIVDAADELRQAPLYTKYVKKKDEYRVHVFNGKVIDVQRKALREGQENPNWEVRNLDNGFVFVRGGVVAPDSVSQQALKAVAALGLDFGAVDLCWNDKSQSAYVLEVNTAPGLEGQTVHSYANAIKEYLNIVRP